MSPARHPDPRVENVRMRVTPAEREAYYAAAQACNMKFSDWARQVLLMGVEHAGVAVPERIETFDGGK
jgi:hypothetical protein